MRIPPKIKEMTSEKVNSDSASTFQVIENVGDNVQSICKNFNETLNASCNTIRATASKFNNVDTIWNTTCTQELSKEIFFARACEHHGANAANDLNKHAEMKDLENQEAVLLSKIEVMKDKIHNIKNNEAEKTKVKGNLELLRNYIKISKILTGASFNCQGPSISGILKKQDAFHAFNFNLACESEQEIIKRMWELQTAGCSVNY